MIIDEVAVRRPGRPKSEAKAIAIREAASQLFMTDGIERTSMDAIAQAAGVSKQTVYSHFKSKDDLFRECIRAKIRDYGLQTSGFPATATIDDKLRHVGSRFLTLLSDPEVICMFRLMIAEATAFPRVSEAFHETGPLATIEFMTEIFAAHLDDEHLGLARRIAGEFAALLKGEYMLLLGARDGIAADEIRDHVELTISQFRTLYPMSDQPVR